MRRVLTLFLLLLSAAYTQAQTNKNQVTQPVKFGAEFAPPPQDKPYSNKVEADISQIAEKASVSASLQQAAPLTAGIPKIDNTRQAVALPSKPASGAGSSVAPVVAYEAASGVTPQTHSPVAVFKTLPEAAASGVNPLPPSAPAANAASQGDRGGLGWIKHLTKQQALYAAIAFVCAALAKIYVKFTRSTE